MESFQDYNGKSLREIPVLFENDFCMVLDKPSGLAVQGGKGVKTSLDSILSKEFEPRPLLVHRLDRDTSGVIIVAKTKEAAAELSALLGSSRLLVKQYLGVCANAFGNAECNIPGGGEGGECGAIRLDLDVRGRGKEAETFYRLVKTATCELPDGTAFSSSLLELELGTGRMHQLRRHLALVGHPLLGDDKYGDFPLNKRLKKAFGLKNLLLHASRLAIPPEPPLFPVGLDVTAPLPGYFAAFLAKLGI
jgi:23S rRNA pseudouridine955/2504/2580 synthase